MQAITVRWPIPRAPSSFRRNTRHRCPRPPYSPGQGAADGRPPPSARRSHWRMIGLIPPGSPKSSSVSASAPYSLASLADGGLTFAEMTSSPDLRATVAALDAVAEALALPSPTSGRPASRCRRLVRHAVPMCRSSTRAAVDAAGSTAPASLACAAQLASRRQSRCSSSPTEPAGERRQGLQPACSRRAWRPGGSARRCGQRPARLLSLAASPRRPADAANIVSPPGCEDGAPEPDLHAIEERQGDYAGACRRKSAVMVGERKPPAEPDTSQSGILTIEIRVDEDRIRHSGDCRPRIGAHKIRLPYWGPHPVRAPTGRAPVIPCVPSAAQP